ncbi:hypothetical protein BGV54_21680 [Burkholderia ubonensis]|uniref:hypothetical protein n=1 Tax=Burkholderia ubonensis TaxID=101571 RepID=UPI0008FDEB2C|nr:hypothetical protein [Burkholderia ubonensis]OJB17112.1 hypothetical protein BGV54_21680 [Burkholderia ubonensis]
MPNDIVKLSAEEYQALIAARAERDALRGAGDMSEALRVLSSEDTTGLSANVATRLKTRWGGGARGRRKH